MKNNRVENIIKVLVVEDEVHAQKELKRLFLSSNYNIEILEIIDSVDDAIEWINTNHDPDLMFFDIQLSDGLSFSIFENISSKAPVIFTTAYDKFAIQAFKVNSIDYLLKPIKLDELNNALDKFLSIINSDNNSNTAIDSRIIEEFIQRNKPKYKTRFIVKIGDQILHIPISEIAYFKSEDNETIIVAKNKKQFIIDLPLDKIISLVDPDLFYRINRSIITHIESITKINKYFNSRLHLKLEPSFGAEVLISRVKVPDFLNWIDK